MTELGRLEACTAKEPTLGQTETVQMESGRTASTTNGIDEQVKPVEYKLKKTRRLFEEGSSKYCFIASFV